MTKPQEDLSEAIHEILTFTDLGGYTPLGVNLYIENLKEVLVTLKSEGAKEERVQLHQTLKGIYEADSCECSNCFALRKFTKSLGGRRQTAAPQSSDKTSEV